MEVRPVGAELYHADGRTDRQNETTSRVSQFREYAYNGRNTLYIYMQ